MLFLRNARYLDSENFSITSTHIAVEEGLSGKISFIDHIPSASERSASDKEIDCKQRIVTRAFACGHHHIYSALALGMPSALEAPTNFLEVLERIWWRLDKCLDADMIKASALATGMALAKNGVPFCIDHHASPFAVEGSLDIIKDAFIELGIGHLLCYEISDRDGMDIAKKGLDEHERFFKNGGKGHVGLHASFTVSDETLDAAVALAKKYATGVHIHVAEDAYDQTHCHETYGKSVIRRLKDTGALDIPQTILGHCVHLSEEDKEILSDSPCWIVQNIESNCNNSVGLASYNFTQNIMYGTDGMHSDMIRSAQSAYFLGIGLEGLDCSKAYTRFRNVHRHSALHGACGDSANNLVILSDTAATPLHENNFLGHFFYGLDSRNVDDVISQGRLIVSQAHMTTCDEHAIQEFTKEQAKRLWEKL